MPKILTLILIFSSFIFRLQAQIRIYSNEFLSVGIGAKALALSNAVVASSDDVYSGFWNPAGLNFIQNNYEIAAMHSEYFAGIAKFDYLGSAYKINDSSVIAGSLIRFGIDNIPNTLELIDENGNIDYNRISYFSVADWAFLLSYAKKSSIQGLSYGVSTKIIFRNQGEFAKAFGFGFDIGLKYMKKKWLFGANLKDATSTFNAWFYNTENLQDVFIQTGNDIPENSLEITMPELIIGAARNFKLSDKFSFRPEIDIDFSFDGKKYTLLSSKVISIDPYFGGELNFKNIIFFRTGIGNFSKIPDFDKETLNFQPSIGLGINIYNFKLDYALTDIGNQSIALYSNVFSLSYGFNNLNFKHQ
ncbi:MAG: PorV/PorQ family protein [Bacteroidales bacterium]|nr:PorV/PorQ family protein [Bacteroidales bacterium]